MKITDLKQMIHAARTYYPGQRNLQRQWVRKTYMLMASGKHALMTGGFNVERMT